MRSCTRWLAHSVEAWQNGALVGGLYGISIGAFFAGESMFALAPDASKCAFVHLVRQTHEWGFQFIDCQMHTPHLERFGAQLIPRSVFLTELDEAVQNRMNHVSGPLTAIQFYRSGLRSVRCRLHPGNPN